MKFRKLLIGLILVLPFLNSNLIAQNIAFKATYIEKGTLPKDKVEKIPEYLRPQVMPLIEKSLTKTMELSISDHESLYKEIEEVDDTPANVNINIVTTRTSERMAIVYKDVKEDAMLTETMLADKGFLISENLNQIDWNIEDETKKIGQYEVRKATAVINGEQTIAWFTTEIPINHGPKYYWGLPGLILGIELESGFTITCEEITMNAKIDIKRPSKGKTVTRDEFTEYEQKYIAEVLKNANPGEDGVRIKTN